MNPPVHIDPSDHGLSARKIKNKWIFRIQITWISLINDLSVQTSDNFGPYLQELLLKA